MAVKQFQTMSGGKGAEVTFEVDDLTGALNVQIGNDRGSPLVRVGFELPDGTVYEFEQNRKTVRTIEYTGIKPLPARDEVVTREGDEEDVEDEPLKKRRQQWFRRKQAIRAADRAQVAVQDDGEGEYLNFKRTWRQEVY